MSSVAHPQTTPLADLNTTPLIDVLLVLLILFVITVPAATHSLDIPLPSDTGPLPPLDPQRNTLSIARSGQLVWNGTEIRPEQLGGLLIASSKLVPEPELRFEPDGQAPYAIAASAMQTIKHSGIKGFGFVGNERFAEFGR